MLTRRSFAAGALSAAAMPLVPAAAQTPSLPFLVVGDWGRGGAHDQREVGATMGRVAETIGSQFTLSVGDNFYENGVAGTDDPQWQDSFETIYSAPALMRPWHLILGNHDYRGNVDAQLRYQGSPRWHMPARTYARSETLPDGMRADFFHIDTSPFVTAYRGTRVGIDGQDTAAQLAWLECALAASRAAWRIVVGHHPVLTATGGTHDTLELVGQLKPLLDRHRIQAYLCGHVHNLQEAQVDGVCYVTSGAGSLVNRVRWLERDGFAAERHGFVAARLDRDALALSYVDVSGTVLHETILPRS